MTGPAWPPSGEQIELRDGPLRAVVVEVGGGLRELALGDWHILDGFAVDAMADGGRGQPLLPWPNRLQDGRYTFDAHDLQLPIDEVPRANAIHGLTRWLSWHVRDRTESRAELGLTVHPRPGYPFTLDLTIAYELAPGELSVTTTAHNVGSEPLPLGAGQHPYVSVGTPTVNEAWLRVDAAERVELDPNRGLPTGRRLSVAGSDWDFGEARSIGSLVIDQCLTGLARDGQDRIWAELSDPTSQRRVRLWAAEPYRYLQVFTGDTLEPDRRRHGLALEPMTCPPNAFRTGDDLIVLAPGEKLALSWGLSCSPGLASDVVR